MDDAEDQLAWCAWLFAAFGGPAHGALDGGAQFARCAGVWGAIVEDHRDVGAELGLDLHGLFGAEEKE